MAVAPPWQPPPAGRAALLWGGAALVAVAAHVGAVWYALHRPVAVDLPASPPPAVMIDLAPQTAAPQSDMMELAPGMVDRDEVVAPTALETPDAPATVEDRLTRATELAPVAPPPALPPAPVPPTVIPEVVLPPPPRQVTRPPPVEAERTAEKPKPPAPQQAQRAARSTAAAPAPKAVARESGAGSEGSKAEASWQAELSRHLNRTKKRYPPAARSRQVEGVAQVRFTIDDAGNVLTAKLTRSSGSAALDGEVLALMRRASPVPAPPPGTARTITVPIRFDLR